LTLPPVLVEPERRLEPQQESGMSSSTAPATTGEVHAERNRLLATALTSATVRGWAGPLLVTAFGAWLRLRQLSVPRAIVFDETYYVPQAFGILRYGAEHAVRYFTGLQIPAGNANIFLPGGVFAAHPPFGKVQIALGEWLFGLNPFGWRVAGALAGSASILLLARITRRMTGSDLLGCVAGLLLALDGLEFVMSRTAMLDIFVMFWVLAGFGCLVVDRDRARERLTELSTGLSTELSSEGGGPRLGIRWWRVAAGFCLGLAVACKWNGLFFLVLFAPLCVMWDMSARRAAGFRGYARGALVTDGVVLLPSLWLSAAIAYLATWSGWFASSIGWDRNYAAAHGVHTPVISALYSLYEYHREMLSYGLNLNSPATFASPPWTWLLLNHPVRFYYAAPLQGENGCGVVGGCVQNVLAVGTPAIWWACLAALPALAVWGLLRRDWRAGAALYAVAAGWLPWYAFPARTEYFYYAVSFEPFLCLVLALCIGLILGPPGASRVRRAAGAGIAAAYLLAVALNFAYLYPVLAGSPISHPAWLARMWLSNWI
jgi:dolichyl-phosphate-mannose-protein mannosyltransferase